MTSIRDFQIINKLGEGAYSSVYKVKRLSDNQEYALKKVKLQNLSEKEKLNALNEVRILASIRHANIISYKEAFVEETSSSLCIIMEYCNNGDLFQKIVEHQKKGTGFSETEIWNMFIQMTKAIKSLHEQKIFHRDLKSANVFLNKDGTVKLGDMNVSKIAKKGLLYTQTGTPYYASPEVWRDMPYDHKSDVWSLGCVLYEITTLKPPFRAEDMEGLYKKVLRGYYPRIPTHYSQDLSNVIRALLQVSPHLRPSCDKILQLPAVIKKMEDRHFTELDEGEQEMNLLNTIRVPKNLHFLTERLPKANYSQVRTRNVDKNKFLQTLAGYKDSSGSRNFVEDVVRGSESVDSYKKEKDNGRVYLPPVGKDGSNGKDILKIYGNREKEKKELIKNKVVSRKLSVEEDEDLQNASVILNKNNDKKLGRIADGHDEKNSARSKERDEESTRQLPNNVVVSKLGYKVKDLNQDLMLDKSRAVPKNNQAGKSSKFDRENVESKDHLTAMINRIKVQGMNRSPSQEYIPSDYSLKKHSKLPSLAQDKYAKLPPLDGQKVYQPSISPKKNKLKELSKAYKVQVGNLDDVAEKYTGGSKLGRKEKPKNYSTSLNSGQDYAINGIKYGNELNRY